MYSDRLGNSFVQQSYKVSETNEIESLPDEMAKLEISSIIKQDNIHLNNGTCAIHILRKVEHTKNKEHAFFLIEILDIPKRELRFERYDFVQNQQNNKKSQVVVHESVVNLSNKINTYINEKDIFDKATLSLQEVCIDEIKECVGISREITTEELKKLKEDIQKDIQEPKAYFLSGGKSMFKRSMGVDENAHNCFTWCREKMNNNTKHKLPEEYLDYFAAITSSYLKKERKEEPTSQSCLLL